MTENSNSELEKIQDDFLQPLGKYSPLSRLWIGLLLIVALWGAFAYIRQLVFGLEATAMRNYVTWGLYISTFVFFIGISHSGTLVSAILRITNKEWRRPITRSAELLTFVSLLFGGLMPIIDMGRPDRIHHMVIYGRLQSPLMWDIICIGTYFFGSTLFLYLPMIPDLAICRDRLAGKASKFRMWLYTKLSLGWKNTTANWERLELAMKTMTIIIIPIAVSVHTVVGYIFAMTLRPGWNSTIFGPYFVAGALYSGSAAVILVMAAFRKVNHLESYITQKHFNYMGQIVLALTLIYLYFNINEYAVPAYKMESSEGFLLHDLFEGTYSTIFWTLQFGTVIFPAVILSFPRGRTPAMAVIASIIIVTGAWVKRYIIVIPTLLHPILPMQDVPFEWSHYFPNWVEWSVTFGALAGIFLVITIFSKLFPIVSIWEIAEGREIAKHQGQGGILSPQSETTPHLVRQSTTILLLCLVGVLGGSMASFAQDKQQATLQLSFYKSSDGARTAIATVMSVGKEGRPRFTPGVRINFYAKQDTALHLIGSAYSSLEGKAVIDLPKNLSVNESGGSDVLAKIENDSKYSGHDAVGNITDVNLSLSVTEHDSSRVILARLSRADSGVPISGTEIAFYVQRLFGAMPLNEYPTVETDEEGIAEFEFPGNVKGDKEGNIAFVARIEDHDAYGNVEDNVNAPWGIPLEIKTRPFPRALWEPRAPFWLKVSFSLVFGGLWLTYGFVIYQLVKLEKRKINS